VNAGNDTVVACYDEDTNKTCDTEEETASATTTWVADEEPPAIDGSIVGRSVTYFGGTNNYKHNVGLRVTLSGLATR